MRKSRRIDENELGQAAQVLARAFYRDPLQNYTFPDDEERAKHSPAHFAAALKYGYKFGEVYTIDDVPGASIWLKPGETEITPEKADEGGFTALPGQIGEEAFSRFFTAISYAEELHKKDMPEPHWYTMVLGVDPELQGHGYGPALMQPVFERSAAEGTPIYLETAQPKNVAFYEKLGFRVLRDVIEPSSGVRLWTFRRDPGISPVN
jgi:ribosomal protein S18 acetylase RimI-like enzyme